LFGEKKSRNIEKFASFIQNQLDFCHQHCSPINCLFARVDFIADVSRTGVYLLREGALRQQRVAHQGCCIVVLNRYQEGDIFGFEGFLTVSATSTIFMCWINEFPKGNNHFHSLNHSLTHSLIHSLNHSLNHSLTYSLNQSLIHSLNHSITHSLNHSLNHSLTYSLNQSLIHSLNHSLTQSINQSLIHSLNHSYVTHSPIVQGWRPTADYVVDSDQVSQSVI
jgi:signal-transduction protein with cAMP-binding, CBS, and nucleotidyltransferase domain